MKVNSVQKINECKIKHSINSGNSILKVHFTGIRSKLLTQLLEI